LGLGEKEFWGLTLAQFDALAERWLETEESADYRAALVCSVVANVNRDRRKRAKPFGPRDFMPDRRGRKNKQSDWRNLKAQLKAAFGGVKDG